MSELNASDLIDRMNDIGTCMFTTVDASGLLVSRPMSISAIDDDHHVWFFTPLDSDKVAEVLGEGQVNLAFSADKTWISVAGTADVVKDEEKREQLKDMGAEAYFSDAADDPRAALLRVTPESAHYWEGPGKAVRLVKLAAAAVSSGQPNMGDQGSVNL
ncbi:pyridoxamine 5'-phosphate oxidase family protein [Nesterenkonia sp. NBAIMH1]|uniref:pyridoxamine 5'-phosphate oxidase family protein n=1 Tax=Nesterenkonia sp. NBAIMH1 TaxID=2600320 RepID=UPI0011B41DAC|nr:pyridoxamine 5'-phosphate oxidase family protein [Nesterenkonia sp. NBAIMH1]